MGFTLVLTVQRLRCLRTASPCSFHPTAGGMKQSQGKKWVRGRGVGVRVRAGEGGGRRNRTEQFGPEPKAAVGRIKEQIYASGTRASGRFSSSL